MDAFRSLFAVFLLTAACSSTSDLGTNAEPGPPDAPPDTIADAAPDAIADAGPDTNDSGTLSGILGGKFVLNSGYGHMNNDGSIDVILSDLAGACASAVANRVHAGETFLQAYGLKGTAPGVFTSSQVVKYATIDPLCPPDQRASFSAVKSGRATVSKVNLSKVTAATVEGEMSATFDDGSSVAGTFTVPTCSSVLSEVALCY
jgi:hypothetical protein